ncbi:MAG: hypothetical protein NT173_12130, partial [Opitutales bacterium]|nr:hypothetical protein [Opitutales bacterium]
MYFSRSLLLLSATLTAAGLPGAAAAEPPAATIVLPAVVVTTRHTQQPLVVTADPKAPAQPMPAHDGAEVLKSIPGFAVIRKGGADGDPVLRGLAGSRLGIQIDGECLFGGCGNRMDPPTAYVFPAAYDRLTPEIADQIRAKIAALPQRPLIAAAENGELDFRKPGREPPHQFCKVFRRPALVQPARAGLEGNPQRPIHGPLASHRFGHSGAGWQPWEIAVHRHPQDRQHTQIPVH